MKKLQNGDFISPQKLELVYAKAPIVNQIYVDINSNYSFLVAVVTLHEDQLRQFATVNDFKQDLKDLVKMPDIEYGVLKQLEKAGEVNGLAEVEIVKRVVIYSEPFTPANGLLTNSQKMKRLAVAKMFKNELAAAYKTETEVNDKSKTTFQ